MSFANQKKDLIRLLSTVTIAAIALTATAASASTQDDIEACRVALAGNDTLNIDDYRLSFEKKKGNSNRVLTLKAIPNSGGEKYIVTCSFKKNQIDAVTAELAS